MSSEGEQRAPDSVQPILGWRVWYLNTDGILRPIAVAGQQWLAGTNEARCHMTHTRHRAPAKNCVCGFNALHNLPEEFRGDGGYAIGAIAAWGEVDVYRTGFRAQFACVLGLLADASPGSFYDRKLRTAGDYYRVPVLPLPELRAHVNEHAQPAGELARPGINRRPRSADRPAQPLPVAALPASFEGRGVQVNAHLAVDHRGRFMRLGPTPSLAALAGDQIVPTVVPGAVLAEGEPLFVATIGTSMVLAPNPAPGTVIAVNDQVPRLEEGPGGAGWLVELRLDAESLDGTAIAWGRRGAEAYREYVLAAGSDADLVLTCAENPGPSRWLLDPAEGRAWLREFAQRLNTQIRADQGLCAALSATGGVVDFEVAGLEGLRVGPPPIGSGRWAATAEPVDPGADRLELGGSTARGPDPGGPELRIELRPDDLRRYWRGELGLAPDHVSLAVDGAAADRGAAPLHLRAGDRGRLLLLNSLHKRVFGPATEILDELGNPWFKAGDAVADPVRNLEVLAGFSPPGESLGGAA